MFFKKSIWIGLLSFQLLLLPNGPTVSAAPPENELNQYLAQIGWTKQQLMDYLNYYEIPLNEFNSVTDLKDIMGTPITKENYHELLTKYNLTDQQLKDLLSQFGDSLNDYKFIEDLDTSVDFYVNHGDIMGEIQDELGKIGITDQEINKFFDYLNQVEEDNKNQLDQLQMLDTRLQKFLDETDPTQLTEDEIDELAQILTQIFDLYEIQVKFKMNNKDITLNNLLKMQEVPGTLMTSIYSKTGELLMDFTIPAEFFQSLVNGWNQILQLGDLSNELIDFLHDQKYNFINGKLYK